MEFVLNGHVRSLDAETVLTRVVGVPPDPIRTHWVEISGRRWPPKQAFRVATGITDEPFISHFALRIFQRLGFETSPIPAGEPALQSEPKRESPSDTLRSSADVLAAFERLDGFLASGSLTAVVAALE